MAGRERWRQDRITGEFRRVDDRSRPTPAGIMIMPDIEPYKNMVTHTMITSRSQHREFLRRHNKQEVGNEMPGWMREQEYVERHRDPKPSR